MRTSAPDDFGLPRRLWPGTTRKRVTRSRSPGVLFGHEFVARANQADAEASPAGRDLGDSMEPLVSVRVVTYNHLPYIAACLEGILMQRTTFPFEVIVGDDCSMDGTREIVRSYQERFPALVTAILGDQNVGLFANMRRVRGRARGRYHALCDGDDQWIDPLKLQKQVDFLESRPECTLCGHDALIVEDNHDRRPRWFCQSPPPVVMTMCDVLSRTGVAFPASSLVVRREVYDDLPGWQAEFRAADNVVLLWAAHRGSLGFLPEAMSLYRKHSANLTLDLYDDLERYFAEREALLRRLDDATNRRYHAEIEASLARRGVWRRSWLRRRRCLKWLGRVVPLPKVRALASRLLGWLE